MHPGELHNEEYPQDDCASIRRESNTYQERHCPDRQDLQGAPKAQNQIGVSAMGQGCIQSFYRQVVLPVQNRVSEFATSARLDASTEPLSQARLSRRLLSHLEMESFEFPPPPSKSVFRATTENLMGFLGFERRALTVLVQRFRINCRWHFLHLSTNIFP